MSTANARQRPSNWKALAPPPLPGTTFAAQAKLPRLPVPPLKDTLDTLKETLRPLAWNDAEYASVVRKVDEFAKGPAQELQRRLTDREAKTEHWLEEWWDDGAYLTYRDSVCINVSYYYGFDAHPAHLPQTALHRAASIVRAGMLFRQQYKTGALPPEATKEGPICVDTYRWMFDCCRVPGQPADWSVTYAREGDRGDSGHVVVLRRGRVWKLNPWKDGRLLGVDELQSQLRHIYENTREEYPAIGILTASNRDVWTKDYDTLAADAHNEDILRTIHSAAFVLCLDAEHAPDMVAHSRLLWHGALPSSPEPSQMGLRNRWMDKPCQFVVTDDGAAGFIGEHSVMDGTPTVYLCDTVLDTIAAPDFASSPPASPGSASLPTALDWHVSAQTTAAIQEAARAAHALASSQALNIVRTPYGKAAIKGFRVSPDSWAQMLVQLAYARHLGARGERREGGTYEAASSRRFFKGRTEAIRVVSAEADAWVASMDDAAVSVEERGRLFKRAVETHVARAKRAGNGLGVDRHLLGLRKTLKEGEPMPEVFSDPVVQRSSTWVLSTSAVFSKHFGPYGWGEVVPNGFGVPYMTGFDDYLQYTITSRTDMPNAEFCAEIERAAKDMYDLHVALAGSSHLKARM
ncbi:carnitine acetyl transferase [Rhodofomes roseus]|uniref:Carnitine acetyl transferase n=1 Tax=Rhodofomes roseus TaxID=34475 RepID=A0ABQ8K6C8_9APHY|nr:carnitine acetyl transferase [Rhodofomes roseus]KAH9832561.1 carnitine acetyl transferase [Rhodofomes roseus]